MAASKTKTKGTLGRPFIEVVEVIATIDLREGDGPSPTHVALEAIADRIIEEPTDRPRTYSFPGPAGEITIGVNE